MAAARNNQLFSDGNLRDTIVSQLKSGERMVDAIPEAQFINSADDEMIEHVQSQVSVEPLALHEEAMVLDRSETQVDVGHFPEYSFLRAPGTNHVPALCITVSIPFTGDATLWKMRPGRWLTSGFPCAEVHGPHGDSAGYILITITRPSDIDPASLKRDLDSILDDLRFYLKTQKDNIEAGMGPLPERIRQAILRRRERLEKHDALTAILGIPLMRRAGAPDSVTIPVQRKLVRPLPPAPSTPGEPGIRAEDYEHILAVIRHEGRSMERTPATFAKHGEEELRDIVLAHLNGHYEGDAGGETFRKRGKTDIVIEAKNRAAFVAECKIWRGDKAVGEAVDQLLGYLTWRDCKTALIIFNTHVAGFRAIQERLPDILTCHEQHHSALTSDEASEFRHRFCSTGDPERLTAVHTFLFDLHVSAD